MKPKKHMFRNLLMTVLVLDVLFLNWWIFVGGGNLGGKLGLVERRLDSVIIRDGSLGDEVLVNKAAAEAVKNLKPELAAMQKTSEPTPTSNEAVLGANDEEILREYFVPLGTGATTHQEWSDVESLQATVNGDRYGEVVAVYFEGSMKSVNGKAEARLLDRTTSSVIHQSNIEHEGSEFGWVISKAFELFAGGKTYMVQMRSNTGEKVEMNGARLRIVARETR